MQGGRRLEGAKFLLLDCNRQEIMCVMTDDCGEAFIDRIPFGRYYLVEVQPPQGYARYKKEIEIVIDENSARRCIEIVNYRRTGSLNIIKTESQM